MRLEFIQPHDLRNWWATVKPGLDRILRKSPEPWIPEDVYAHCVSGKAGLWMAMKDNYAVGFVVGYPNGNTFHVWCAYGNLSGDLKTWFSKVEDIAKAAGSTRIAFDSWRSGWNKKATELGFKPRSWAKEI
jgi:hypothetical protein